MKIDKQTVIDLLTSHGDQAKADQAMTDLPEQVDTDQDTGLLHKLGIDPSALLGQLPGGLAGKLPGGQGGRGGLAG